ncbi:unnamed protein product [Brassicogethes aeneus]|uniref:Uncharacterized protein n=1 Tax=Brassicogethes aeneus TaxID=1431903 RepID=A0A9P0B0D1_BRAAE|nr:unnamed protein product [Brassicogethes aeneus]
MFRTIREVIIIFVLREEKIDNFIGAPSRKTNENSDKECNNHKEQDLTYNEVRVLNLKHEIDIAKIDLEHTKRLVSELERTIEHQKEIISLLKYSQPKQIICDVANTKLIPQNKGKFNQTEKTAVETIVKNKETQKKQEHQTEKNANKTIGNNSDVHQSFASATRKAWLCISKIKVGTKCEDIETHLKSKFPNNDFTIEELPRRKEAASMSFKLGADTNLLNELNKPETWPNGIYIKRFYFNQGTFGEKGNKNE